MATLHRQIEEAIAAAVNKAKFKNLWFYNSRSGIWLTPDEFNNECQVCLITGWHPETNPLVLFYMQDPKQGIKTRMDKMVKASQDFQQFTDKVMNYFNLVNKIID